MSDCCAETTDKKGTEHAPAAKPVGKANAIIIGVAVVLLIFAGIQAFQIDAMQDKLEPGSGAAIAPVARAPAARQSAPSQPLAMVGGC